MSCNIENNIDTVANDDDVQFLWALLSCDIYQEEHAIGLLKEIAGFSSQFMALSCWNLVRTPQKEIENKHP